VRIELPIETERLVIRPLQIEDAADLREPAEWIQEKIDRFERDEGMSPWAAVERQIGRAVALAGLQWEQKKLEFTPQGATTFEGRQYALFVRNSAARAAR
jgi:hypothetical protein